MFKKLFISCDEATTICDKSQYNESSIFEKIQLNFHFVRCKICRLYTKQNNIMSDLFKMKSEESKSGVSCMSNAEKDSLKKQLEEFKI